MQTRKPTIAIDGYSSTGKSSISKIIAGKLGLIHLDTGALYRGIVVYALEHFLEGTKINIAQLSAHLSDINLELRKNDACLELILNGINIDREIRDPEVSAHVSEVAKVAAVRDFLLHTQRNIAKNGGVIMDGRDIGTVVLPDADYKFFLEASVEERTKRRWKELQQSGIDIEEEAVKQNLITRDKIDSEREVAPLRKAEDAILIDNTHLDKKATIDLILSYIKEY